jgi:hypothetical protein
MNSSSTKLEKVVGFSNGNAELTLKNPPPLVPSSLMAICEATGPIASTCPKPCRVVTVTAPVKFCTTPWETSSSVPITDSGSRIYSSDRVRSTQKLPSLVVSRRAKPRMTAASTAMPTAAETKFCTASPAIWEKCDMVVSPP